MDKEYYMWIMSELSKIIGMSQDSRPELYLKKIKRVFELNTQYKKEIQELKKKLIKP